MHIWQKFPWFYIKNKGFDPSACDSFIDFCSLRNKKNLCFFSSLKFVRWGTNK